MSSRLLPPNAQPYTRALADAHDTHGRLKAHLDLIPQIGRTQTPAEWVPWILRNRGLEPLMPHVDWQTLLDHGQAWLRIRGTPHASLQALGWIGWPVRFEGGTLGMPDYDAYHIHLDRVPWRHELERIIEVERLAKSTDSHFYRLTAGWDVRKVRPGFTRHGSHIFGADSGLRVRDDWPLLSFRVRAYMLVRCAPRAAAGDTLLISTYVGGGHIRGGFSLLPERATRGPTWGVTISDSILATAELVVRHAETIRPLAGIVGGRSRIGARQSVFGAWRLLPGERPRPGYYRFGGAWHLPRVVRLMAVSDPERADAVSVSGSHPLAAAISNAAGTRATVPIETAATETVQMSDHTVLTDAGWSGLPWRDAPWGDAPATIIDILETA
ncbi:hypothetical protein [Castellaniella sp.]|uniref:hypothetical protein n=1 Tax=Castellaniella sp. TaxID=1955812 RepID=UPI002AFFC7A0|nr:hypothetical protein [Castellaniella sp.]